MPLKVAVIGSNSFSGSNFIKLALSKGWDVFGFSRSQEPDPMFLPYKWINYSGRFYFTKADLNKNLDQIMDIINKEKIKYIVNFAAQSMVAQSWEYPEHWFQTNVISMVNFHNKLRYCDFLEKYVHVTTPEVYGSTNDYIKEDHHFLPSTPYAVSRAAADFSLMTFFNAYNFPVVFTRAANVYGPGQQLYRIIPKAILSFSLGSNIELHGGGISKRSFIHINDVVDATWLVMLQGRIGETYHISTKEIVTIEQLVKKICIEMNVDFNKNVKITQDRLGKDSAYLLNSDKIRKELNWNDKISLKEGILECITWTHKHLDALVGVSMDYLHKA